MRAIFATLGSLSVLVNAGADHPVNSNIVSEIKNKTTKWEPLEASENPIG